MRRSGVVAARDGHVADCVLARLEPDELGVDGSGTRPPGVARFHLWPKPFHRTSLLLTPVGRTVQSSAGGSKSGSDRSGRASLTPCHWAFRRTPSSRFLTARMPTRIPAR